MDDNSRRRRQNDPSYQSSDPRFNTEQTQSRGFSNAAPERFRPSPITTSTPGGRGSGATAYSSYYSESNSTFSGTIPQGAMGFQTGYPEEQRQQQNFPAYNPDILYPQQNHVYDSSTQFQTRQPASMQMLSDVAAPYLPTSAPGPPGLQHHASSNSSTVYQQAQGSPSDRGSLIPQSYPATLTMGGITQGTSELMGEEEYQAEAPGMEAAYTAYQTALKEIFQNIISVRLSEASQSLLQVSEWLLGHVGDLGLTVDESALHGDRIRLWGEFNTAWLSIFQKQKDLLESNLPLQSNQSLMSKEFVNKMAKDLIRMCDAVEKHGLVDYQYGVAEEQIILILTECLDIQESIEGVDAGSGRGRAPP